MREYNSFDDLIKQNKSLFKRILDQGHIDLMRACWHARDPEVNRVEKNILRKEEEVKDLTSKIENLSQELGHLKDNLQQQFISIENLEKDRESKLKQITELEENCHSLENFNTELLKGNSDLQDEIAKFEELLSHRENEFSFLVKEVEKERLENNIEIKNAKEAIDYANELEVVQQRNVNYIQELETKLSNTQNEADKLKKTKFKIEEQYGTLQTEFKMMSDLFKKEEQQNKNLHQKYQFVLNENKDLEQELSKKRDMINTLNSSGVQKVENLKQLQATLELKVKTLEMRDEELQIAQNKLRNQDEMMAALDEEIKLLEKALEESEKNQQSLQAYSEKLRVTTEREMIKRKENENQIHQFKIRLAEVLTEKENLEAKFNSLEITIGDIQKQLAPTKSIIRPRRDQLQLDN